MTCRVHVRLVSSFERLVHKMILRAMDIVHCLLMEEKAYRVLVSGEGSFETFAEHKPLTFRVLLAMSVGMHRGENELTKLSPSRWMLILPVIDDVMRKH